MQDKSNLSENSLELNTGKTKTTAKNRMHVHLAVADLAQNRRFYSSLFGVEPVVVKDDYIKWQIDEPALNLSISNRSAKQGVDHLGIQFGDRETLTDTARRFETSAIDFDVQEQTNCCYANSDKYWVKDPQGIAWENFYTHASVADPGAENDLRFGATIDDEHTCCVPEPGQQTCCSA